METFKVADRVRFSALTGKDPTPTEALHSSIRPGEVWEGVIVAVAWGADGKQVVTVRVDLLNGMRTVGTKEVYADAVSWEST
jgi:hypothetical protein